MFKAVLAVLVPDPLISGFCLLIKVSLHYRFDENIQSILVTVCTLAGLLFCFRRASKLLPRNLNIQLQMFGQSDAGNTPGRGPIALSDDDLAGATGLEWEDLDAQLHDDEYDINEEEEEEDAPDEELQDMASRPLRPMKRPERYHDNDDGDEDHAEEDQGQELSSFTGGAGRYRDDGDDDDALDAQGKAVASEGPLSQRPKDSPFQLDDEDSEQEV